MKNKRRITLHIATRDRHTELALLLQSLRTQILQNFDIIILDDASGAPITTAHFLTAIITRMKLENHKFKLLRNNISQGCCPARNKCIDEDDFENEFVLRLDDDVILEPDYLEKLLEVIDAGYDMASGVVPLLSTPEIIRNSKFLSKIINEHVIDEQGTLISSKDECGYCYSENLILPTHQFRTNVLYKQEVQNKVRYPENLSTVAFREEGFFSFKAILAGYKIGIHTGAICFHLQTPSGGNRRKDYAECVKIDEETWQKWIKKQFNIHGNFLMVYDTKIQMMLKDKVKEIYGEVQIVNEDKIIKPTVITYEN